jgi:hypothetical protein
MLVIKIILLTDKIHAQIQENKKKSLRNKVNSNENSKKLWKQAEAQKSKKDKRNSNQVSIKKKPLIWELCFSESRFLISIYILFNTRCLLSCYP